MEGPACGLGSPRRANPLRKASGSCLSLARMSTALLSVHSGFELGYNEGGGGCGFGLRETWFDLREGCAKLLNRQLS